MALEIISGGAGTGKTRRCMDLLVEMVSTGRSQEVLFLLYNNDQVQAAREHLRGELDACIEPSLLTFNGLIREILFRSLSPPPGIAPQNVALHLFRAAVEDVNPSYYRRATVQPGLLKLLKDAVDELKTNGVSPHALQDAARQLSNRRGLDKVFADKTGEVIEIYRRYQQLLKEHGYEEWPDAAYRAVQSLREAPELLSEKRLLLMDGFFYLTLWQEEMLRTLIERVPRSVMTICYDGERGEVFGCLEDMHAFLTGFPRSKVTRLTENRRARTALLRHIESQLFRPAAPTVPADESISIFEAAGREAEVEMIARSIKRMVMEEGYQFTDFGVLLRSDADYKHIFRQVFRRHGIPLVTFSSYYLKEIPGVRAVITLLQIISEGWRRERVISFPRDAAPAGNGSAGRLFPARVVDHMENRTMARGIDDREGWLREFPPDSRSGTETELKSSDIVGRLRGFEERLSGLRTARSLVGALSEVMDELGVLRNTFAQVVDSSAPARLPLHAAGEPDIRLEAAAVVKLHELLGQFLKLTSGEGDDNTDAGELLKFLARSAETETLNLPDETASGVWLSDVFESRVPEVRVVFTAGLLEGEFPPGFSEDPIFRDSERRLLNRTGKLILRERRADVARERYLFYVALTRASEKVVLTYPHSDASGKEKLASFFVDELCKLFDPRTMDERIFRADYPQILPPPDEILNESELVKCVLHGLREERARDRHGRGAVIASLYNLALDRAPGLLKEALAARDGRKKRALSHSQVLRMLQEEKTYTVSEIHTFGSCRFKYYCRYHLRLEPREEKRVDFTTEGEIFHEALRRMYLKATEEGMTAHPRDLRAFVMEGLRELEAVMEEDYAALLSSTRGENLKARMVLTFRSFLEKEFDYLSRCPARPCYLELSFGTEEAEPPRDSRSVVEPLLLRSDEGEVAKLRGRMDRVDLLEKGDGALGIVLDYKRGGADINPGKMLDGKDIRLPLYMLALKRLFGIEPAGGLYYSIRESVKRGVYLSNLREYRVDGEWGLTDRDAFDPQQMEELLSAAEETALRRVKLIRVGEIAAEPLSDDECRHCDYNAVCRRKGRTGRTRQSEGEP